MRVPRIALIAAACAVVPVAAAPASAATLTANQACFIEGFDIGLTGSGFTPSGGVALSGDQIALSGAADAAGNFATPVTAPKLGTLKPATQKVTITATDQTTSETASVDVQVTTAVFATSTGFKSPRANRTWTFSGLFQRPGKPIFGHFRHNGRTYANFRFGIPKGPCGTLRRRAPGIPARTIPAGTWKVQVDFERRYNPKAKPRLTGSTTVITTFR